VVKASAICRQLRPVPARHSHVSVQRQSALASNLRGLECTNVKMFLQAIDKNTLK